MITGLLRFDIPQLHNPHDMSEIHCNLESLAIAAFYIANGYQEILDETIMLDSDIHDYDPETAYEESYDELIEIIGGYNYYINENKLDYPQIKLVIDYEKSKHLNGVAEFPIYKVILWDESI